MKKFLVFAALAIAAPAVAAPWEFAPAIDIVPATGKKVFHHLDAGNRRHIAVSDDTVAVVWEDNRDGTPRAYVATKSANEIAFGSPRLVSGEVAAYDPVIVALTKGRFLIGWEEGDAIWVRQLDAHGMRPPAALATDAGQVSLARVDDKHIAVVWSQRQGNHRQIRISTLEIGGPGNTILAGNTRLVDPNAPDAEQQYPSVAAVGGQRTVAWEDRRRGHTVLYVSHAPDGKKFNVPTALNEVPPKRSDVYGKGTGVMRVSLVPHGERGVAAIWLDKRELAVGYDVYAGFSADGGKQFGPNEKVQDDFGNNITQWHAAIGANRKGVVAAAWDDDREGNADIWLSWRGAEGWSDDLAVPGASGPGQQEAPAIAIDEAGNLHLIWIERADPNAPTRLRYVYGRYVD